MAADPMPIAAPRAAFFDGPLLEDFVNDRVHYGRLVLYGLRVEGVRRDAGGRDRRFMGHVFLLTPLNEALGRRVLGEVAPVRPQGSPRLAAA